jgi:hypothetical protein
LIYLDPPFNSNRNYNVLFKSESGADSQAQITAFEDTWHWGELAEATYRDLITDAPEKVSTAIATAHKLGRKWIGNDSTHLGIALQKHRRFDMFELETRKLFNKLAFKNLKTWTDIRNCAAYGRYNDFTRHDAGLTLPGLKHFLVEHL